MQAVTVKLTIEQAKELEGVLWEMCCHTDDGVKTLREDLPLSEIWRAVVRSWETAARATDRESLSHD